MMANVGVYVGVAIDGDQVKVLVEGQGGEEELSFPIDRLVLGLLEAHRVPGGTRLGEGAGEALGGAYDALTAAARVIQAALAADRAQQGL